MRNIWLLLKVQWLASWSPASRTGIGAPRRNVSRNFATWLAPILFLYLSITYSLSILFTLQEGDNPLILPLLMGIAASLFVLLTTTRVHGTLFAFQDYDSIMSLPVTTTQVVASRILITYFSNLIISGCILLPSGICYGLFTHAPLTFYPLLLVGILFLPMLPTVVGTLLGSLIVLLTAGRKQSSLVSILLNFVLVGGIMVFSFRINSILANLGGLTDRLTETLQKFYPPLLWMVQGLQGNLGQMGLFLLVALLPFALYCLLLARWFSRLNSSLAAQGRSSSYKMKEGEIRQSTAERALLRRELKRYFSSPVYVVNSFFGVVMLVAGTLYLVLSGVDLQSIAADPDLAGLPHLMASFAPMFPAFCLLMSCTTSSSISLEGMGLDQLRSLPVTPQDIFKSKILMNLWLTLPFTLPCCLLLTFHLRLDLLNSFMMLFFPLLCGVFTSVMGLACNLKYPKMEWAAETQAIKNSASSFASTMLGMFIFFGLVILRVVLSSLPLLAALLQIALLLLLTWLFGRWIAKRGSQIWIQL